AAVATDRCRSAYPFGRGRRRAAGVADQDVHARQAVEQEYVAGTIGVRLTSCQVGGRAAVGDEAAVGTDQELVGVAVAADVGGVAVVANEGGGTGGPVVQPDIAAITVDDEVAVATDLGGDRALARV